MTSPSTKIFAEIPGTVSPEAAMDLIWIAETPPRWDSNKHHILSASPPGVFRFDDVTEGTLLPGDWWRVETASGDIVAYGWLDVTWGWAPVLLAVAPDARETGVGTFVLDNLASEGAKRGLHYLFNVIPEAHPEPESLAMWLESRGFEPAQTDVRTLRRKLN
jgi:GNAT superfamily N-acetyltransferase